MLFRSKCKMISSFLFLNLASIDKAHASFPTYGTFWTGGVIPYTFDTRYPHSEEDKNKIRSIMQEFEREANIQFVEKSDTEALLENSYVRVLNVTGDTSVVNHDDRGSGSNRRSGCYAKIGMRPGERNINLSSEYVTEGESLSCIEDIYKTRHEFMHILGFQHEHQRPDQGQNILVNLANAKTAYARDPGAQFFRHLNLPPDYPFIDSYDLESIMHYDSFAGATGEAKANGRGVMTKLNDDLIPINHVLSESDKRALRKFYGP